MLKEVAIAMTTAYSSTIEESEPSQGNLELAVERVLIDHRGI